MCKPASFVMTKGRIFWSKNSESHEEIIREFGLVEGNAAITNIVRIEISPENGDLFSSPEKWIFKVDQDRVPDWFDRAEVEKEARNALKDWVAQKIITSGEHKVGAGNVFVSGSATVRAFGSATVRAFGSATVIRYGRTPAKLNSKTAVEIDRSGDTVSVRIDE